ncbi:iron(III) compound receptor [Alcanivorax nanhaiticus]|uniref:Iron(III) compound receptor n=1 Tax=Alcanivorax nanhaiticus TaxID=1177154 RepID=A0A095SKT6_9GAMM|nr:TonB-dependent siderophore receptor [Alcanivorax nanhaiticus]KGD65162.1 iron(III) compound receptor [Alcanivorax nanhaiticus]
MTSRFRAIWGAPLAGVALLSFSPLAVQAEDAAPTHEIPAVEVGAEVQDGEGYITEGKTAKTGKLKVPVEKTPYAITVVNEEFIKDTGAKNVQDALLYSSGVYAGAFGFDTRGDWVKVRGLDASFYKDGLRSLYGSYNSVRPNVYALESIEVLKGPSSVLYGQAELGGIVNTVSKLPKAEQQGEIWAQVGSYDRKQLAADVTGPMSEDGKLLYRMVALKRESGTQVDYVDDNGFLFAPSFTWLPTDTTTISLLFNFQENNGGISAQFLPAEGTLLPGVRGDVPVNTFVGEPSWDRYDRTQDEVTLFVDQRLNDHWGVAATARYTQSETETREHWAAIGFPISATGDISRTMHMADRSTEVSNFDVRLEGDFGLLGTNHTLAFGVDYQDAMWEEGNYYSAATGSQLNLYNPVYGFVNYASLAPEDRDDNVIRQTGVYLIDHIEIGNVVVSGALRHDESSNTVYAVNDANERSDDSETTGRLGLMYQFDFGLSPYISYSEAFVPNLGTNNGAALAATTGEQQEAGFKYLNDAGDLSVTAAYFYIEETNRVVQGASQDSVDQIGAKSEGWEMEVKKQLGNLELLASYTDIRAVDDQSGERLPYLADQTASTWAKYELENGLRFGAGARYVGDNVGYDYGTGAGPKIPSVTLYDAMLGYAVNQWDFSLNVQNLTDKEYVSWCRGQNGAAVYDCGYGETRTVMGNARYRF